MFFEAVDNIRYSSNATLLLLARVELEWIMSRVHLLFYNTNLIKAVMDIRISIVLAILTFVGDFLRYILPLLDTCDTQNLTKGHNS